MPNVKDTLTKLVDKFKGRNTIDSQAVKNFQATMKAAKEAAKAVKTPKE